MNCLTRNYRNVPRCIRHWGICQAAILKYLAETKTCITGDISEELPLGRTTVNQHLAELKSAGLISGNIDGTKLLLFKFL